MDMYGSRRYNDAFRTLEFNIYIFWNVCAHVRSYNARTKKCL